MLEPFADDTQSFLELTCEGLGDYLGVRGGGGGGRLGLEQELLLVEVVLGFTEFGLELVDFEVVAVYLLD